LTVDSYTAGQGCSEETVNTKRASIYSISHACEVIRNRCRSSPQVYRCTSWVQETL